jgi:hypothetical protein
MRRDDISSRRNDKSKRTDQKSSRRNNKSSRRNQKSLRRDDKSSRTNEISSRRNDKSKRRNETFVSKDGLFSNGNLNYVGKLTGQSAGQAESYCGCPFMGQIGSFVRHRAVSRLREAIFGA